MRRLIPQKDIEYVNNLEQAIDAFPYPTELNVHFDILDKEEMEGVIASLDADENIDWENHAISGGFTWSFYPSNYPLGLEAAMESGVSATVMYDDSNLEFPESITTQAQLVDYLMQGVPAGYIEEAYIDDCSYGIVYNNVFKWYVTEDAIINEDGKSIDAYAHAEFPLITLPNGFNTEGNVEIDGSLTVKSSLNASGGINLDGKMLSGAAFSTSDASISSTQSYSGGNFNFNTSTTIIENKFVSLRVVFNGKKSQMNDATVIDYSTVTKKGDDIELITPVHYYNDSNVWSLGYLKMSGYLCRGDDSRMHLQFFLYDATGTTRVTLSQATRPIVSVKLRYH